MQVIMKKDEAADPLKSETHEITSKINAAYEKLALKLRAKADKAKERAGTTKDEAKRAIHRRRFELYGDAAHDIEERLALRRAPSDGSDD
ncbi:hypothetical protein [Methylobacterium crusticola]|uniref:hypothetical protein n=1 Tax=Methylobacterium crusticola TaxID=1697972 RepID=UPI000FFC71E1|nr:hypothetical protein [Methylobacterium crusticola]